MVPKFISVTTKTLALCIFCSYVNSMIEFDENKRQKCLLERGLDFAEADEVFQGKHATLEDDRVVYSEIRYITAGFLKNRFVVLCWCWRGLNRRIISMRYGHDKEYNRWKSNLG